MDGAAAAAFFASVVHTTAPVFAIRRLLEEVGWDAKDVGLYEVNEAFAVVTMAAMRDLSLPHAKMNVHGGACALGHPIGASGARILVTLLSAMRKYGERKGVTYNAWRELGVPPEVLRRAGISRGRS